MGLHRVDTYLPGTTAPILAARVMSALAERFVFWGFKTPSAEPVLHAIIDFTGVAYRIKQPDKKIDYYNSYIKRTLRVSRIVDQLLV